VRHTHAGKDLVIHCGGPFQKRTRCEVLEAAIDAGVDYVDVCDDMKFAQRAKALHDKAKQAGITAITTTGIYPGVRARRSALHMRIACACCEITPSSWLQGCFRKAKQRCVV
jgi:saccharopine dehydrogenase-like NADP-dependent oxidoreductase